MSKALASALFISLFSIQLLAAYSHDDRCRNLSTHSALSQVKQVEIDLLSGIWSTAHDEFNTMIEFEPNGMASRVEDKEGEIEHMDYLWNLKAFNNLVVLYLTNPEHDSQKYVVTQNCEGIQLKALDGSGTTQWTYTEPLHDFEIISIESQLIGEWRSVADPVKSEMTEFHFDDNGTMSMQEGGKTCTGVWEITEDGDFIMLSLKNEKGEFCRHIALRIYDIGYHAASLTNESDMGRNDIQYFEKI